MKIKFLFILMLVFAFLTEVKAETQEGLTPPTSQNTPSSQDVFKKLQETHNENTVFDDLYNIQD